MLDELIAVIETLKARIYSHRETLQANETRTRVSLIDPLLCALGWNTSDPSLVTLEYDVRGKRADYALWINDGKTRPLLVLEAKRLGEPLSNHRRQMALYAFDEGILFPALTNGDQWEVYDYTEMGSREERRVLHLSIAQDPAAQIALQLLLLWRANMEGGNPQPAANPIMSHEFEPQEVQSQETEPKPGIVSNGSEGRWANMGDFVGTIGARPPSAIKFRDGKEYPITRWWHILSNVAEYLVRERLLTREVKLPIKTGPRNRRYLVNLEPRNFNGRAFRNHYELSNSLFLDTQFSAKQTIEMGRNLLNHFGQDPFQVWLNTG